MTFEFYPMVTADASMSVFSVINSAVNTTLPTFAAVHRAAAPLLLGARRCRSICPARKVLSSKPAARCGGTTRQSGGRTPDRYINPAPPTVGSVSNSIDDQ